VLHLHLHLLLLPLLLLMMVACCCCCICCCCCCWVAGSHYGQPVSLEGWTFVQGLDAPAEGDVAVEGAESAQQLAQACIDAGGLLGRRDGVIVGMSTEVGGFEG
jgi:hypothetical protein